MTTSKGEWVRIQGTMGFGKVLDRTCYPGDQIATVTVGYYGPRSGKFRKAVKVREHLIAEKKS